MEQKFPPHHRLPFIALLAVLLTFTVGTSRLAHAYTFDGYQWRGSPLNLTYTFTSIDSNSRTAFNSAVAAWNAAPDDIYLTSSGAGDIVFETYSANDGYDGQTYYYAPYYCSSGGVQKLQTAWTYLNTYYTNSKSYGNGARQSVAAHEIGHAVGLGHAGTNALMYYSTDRWFKYGIDTPQIDDDNGTFARYSTPC